jgi:hypothetical protein
MTEPRDASRVPPDLSLPDLDSPPPADVLKSVPSREDVVEGAPSVEDIVGEQQSVDDLLHRGG